jgi:hypothetical protein
VHDGRCQKSDPPVAVLLVVPAKRPASEVESVVAAGYRAADLMSLVSSAARNDLDGFLYVKDVLDRLLGGEKNYDHLRPDIWKQSHPEAIRI